MNVVYAIRRLEDAGFTHQQAARAVEVLRGEVSERVVTRDSAGQRTDLARLELAVEIAEMRRERTERLGALQMGVMNALMRQMYWMAAFLVALLVAVLGFGSAVIGKL